MARTGQTLENPASGERITVRRTSADTGGELLAIDLELPAGRRRPLEAAGMTFTYVAAVVTAGLVAGLFFFNASVVMPALAELDDRTFVEVLDKVNDAVYNPLFFAVTFGAPVLIAVAAVQQRRGENPRAARWTWAALALYVAGLMVTMGVNVPLTDDLVAAEPGNAGEFAAVREDFEGPFNAADIVRTILHTAALACLAVAPSRGDAPQSGVFSR